MNLVRRVERDGHWWAERADGSWLRWSPERGGWEGPLEPSWMGEEAGGSVTLVVPGSPGASPDDRLTGRTRIDAWWNRAFPPYSVRRLLFGIAAIPLVAGVHALYQAVRGRDVSFGDHAFVAILGGIILSFIWFAAFRRPGPAPSEAPILADRPDPGSRWARDFLVVFPFALGVVLVIGMLTGNGFDLASMAGSLVSAVLISLIVALRRSVWSVILFSFLAGAGVALVLELFLFFLGGAPGLFLTWILSSLFAFLWAMPSWLQLRSAARGPFRQGPSDPHPGTIRQIPLWVSMAGTLILVVGWAISFVLMGPAP
jgi:hypothetical protein